MGYLAVVDRGYRGTVESQFFDALYGILAFHQQLGSIDVVLRGSSVTAALICEDDELRLRLGAGESDPLPSPRASVRAMVAEGITVYVDEPSLNAFGLNPGSLIGGVSCLDTTELAVRWARYDGVWFL